MSAISSPTSASVASGSSAAGPSNKVRALLLDPPVWFPPLFFLLLAALFLWRTLFTGEVFLPADLLYHLAPWASQAPDGQTLPFWNPLRWDGIGQFYPWRQFAAETLRAGTIPLWNPYQFCGTPFVANSQSAVFYPPNWLFTLLSTARAFGINALLHLTLCGWFTSLLLRRLRCFGAAALLGGVVYAFSAWQVAWLQLPTFLATSCWFPLLLLAAHRAFDGGKQSKPRSFASSFIGVALTAGLMLLAGHLQIAFYGLLMGTFWTLALAAVRGREQGGNVAGRGIAACAIGLALGFMLVAPQLLPSLELSRGSHRAGKPTSAGYQAYTEYALPASGLTTITLPDFFGADYLQNNPYWGFYIKHVGRDSIAIRHNAAETANYVGIGTLLLGLLAFARSAKTRRRVVWFFGGIALFALLLALGTQVNALFYFGVPGFGQSGSPGRSLVLWTLAWAMLAGFGLDSLLREPPTKREIGIAAGGFMLLFAAGLSMAANALRNPPPGLPYPVPLLGETFGKIGEDWLRLALLAFGSLALLVFASRKAAAPSNSQAEGDTTPSTPVTLSATLPAIATATLVLVIIDLFWAGIRTNPTAKPEAVYPETPAITYLRERLGHERVLPVNQQWSLYQAPPAVFPPNAGMVYKFRDVQGYDSLLTGQYKRFANGFARPNRMGITDASPPEVGNMVFFQDTNATLVPELGTAFALTLPPSAPGFNGETAPQTLRVQDAGDMAVYALPSNKNRARLLPLSAQSAQGAITWLEDSPTRVILQTDAPFEARLELADQWYPGWKAWLDGKIVDIERASKAAVFRAVNMPAGRHTVRFRYEPTSFRLGMFLACFALCVMMAARLGSRENGQGR